MKNCLILGSGRSGTSMMGGIMHDSGYFMGDNLYPTRDSNPKGFFENDEINGINEDILSNYASIGNKPHYGQRWLSSIPVNIEINAVNPDIEKKYKQKIT